LKTKAIRYFQTDRTLTRIVSPPLYGGSGNQFDWSILDMYNGHVPFLLSGGINSYSANALKEFKHPRLAGYDLNSRFELKPGEKDPERIRTFLNELKS